LRNRTGRSETSHQTQSSVDESECRSIQRCPGGGATATAEISPYLLQEMRPHLRWRRAWCGIGRQTLIKNLETVSNH
jgi:hypothetical protein